MQAILELASCLRYVLFPIGHLKSSDPMQKSDDDLSLYIHTERKQTMTI